MVFAVSTTTTTNNTNTNTNTNTNKHNNNRYSRKGGMGGGTVPAQPQRVRCGLPKPDHDRHTVEHQQPFGRGPICSGGPGRAGGGRWLEAARPEAWGGAGRVEVEDLAETNPNT